jgi:alpha-amylase
VRTYGIDGFRCDSAKHVDLRTWRELKQACVIALADWKARHPSKLIDHAPFWMTGEVFGNGIARNAYHEHGFDSLINFSFQHEIAAIFGDTDMGDDYPRSLALHRLDRLYARYAATLADGHQILSYLSSHDTVLCDQARHPHAAAALMLAPGGIQIFYGDESGRQGGAATPVDPPPPTRSYLIWYPIAPVRLAHWRRLGQFRSRHPAVSTGAHSRLCVDPYAFSRSLPDGGDAIIAVIGHAGALALAVAPLFADGTRLWDAYGERHYTVRAGRVWVDIDDILLLERA